MSSNFKQMIAEAKQAEEKAVIDALAQAPRQMESYEKTVTYVLPEPVLVTLNGQKYLVSVIRRRDSFYDDEAFTDIEGYSVEVTAKGQPSKRAPKVWRTLPSALASVIAF